jgi:hypothetical protein
LRFNNFGIRIKETIPLAMAMDIRISSFIFSLVLFKVQV